MTTLLINGGLQGIPSLARLEITQGEPFAGRDRGGAVVDAIVLHESAGLHPEATLRRRGIGVHLVVHPDGAVTQHGDLRTRYAHASAMNARSIGLEIVTPYYPPARAPWGPVIDDAPWAHRGAYVLPTDAQLRSTWALVEALTSTCWDGIEIPRTWPGARRGDMALAHRHTAWGVPGVVAHCYEGRHADGGFPALYCYLRAHGRDDAHARRLAVDLATGHHVAHLPEEDGCVHYS